MTTPLTFGSLFAGIGGFDLGFERAGMVCKWQVEIDDYATKVLEKHWPQVHRERDIRQCGKHNLEPVDVICGGFPCQDISYAGLGAGLDGERSGLFFEAIRVVRELRPQIVVLENVAALLTRGLDRVLGTLAEIGFDAEWHCIPAAAVGAPHIRDRVFVIGFRTGMAGNPECSSTDTHTEVSRSRNSVGESSGEVSDSKSERLGTRRTRRASGTCAREEDTTSLANSARELLNGGRIRTTETRRGEVADSGEDVAYTNEPVASEGRIQRGREFMRSGCNPTADSARGLDSNWVTEPDVGRVAHGIPARVDRLRGIGNAVVPQVAEWIGRRIVEAMQ